MRGASAGGKISPINAVTRCESSGTGSICLRVPVEIPTHRAPLVLSVYSTTARRHATIFQNFRCPPRASPQLRRFPLRARRIPGSRAQTPHPPRFPQGMTARASLIPPPWIPVCLLTRPPCAPPSCAPRREFLSAVPGRSRESRARVLRRSSRSRFSAPASAPPRKPKAAFQRNVFRAPKQTHTAPAHLPAHGCGSGGSLRCAARRARRRSKAAPARGIPRRPRPRALDSVFFRRAVREAGQSSFASIAAFPSPVNAHSTSTAVSANQFGLGEDVRLHGPFQLSLRRTGFEIQLRIERGQLEKIAVRLAGRRTRPAVSDLAEIVPALQRAAGKLLLPRHPFRKFLGVCGKVVQNPVHPRSRGGVGIIHDEGKALGICRRFIPFQFRGDVLRVARKFLGDRFSLRKVRACNLQCHGSSYRLREELSGKQRGDAKQVAGQERKSSS